MGELPKVVVIMSTYNGEKFVKEQIDSILAQKDVDVSLHIFDDVSKDKTIEIIKEYEQKYNNVFVHLNEKNKNFTYNFLDGLFMFKDNQDYDFYAFADQDDYWVEDKLITAVDHIKKKGQCTLYSSNLKVVDQDLQYMGRNVMSEDYKAQHYDVLCVNTVTGCTAVMDKEFKNLVTRNYPQNIYLHDYWIALIANFCEGANHVYDTNPNHIWYRQHGGNLIGSKRPNLFKRLWKFTFPKIPNYKLTRHLVKSFCELYSDKINDKDKNVLGKLSNVGKIKNRTWLFFNLKSNFSLRFKAKLFVNKYY